MSSQKVNFLESSLDLMREKMKSYELGKANFEGRLNQLEAKYLTLANASNKTQKQNFSQFDLQLSNSQVFKSTLKKADANNISNLRKIEDYFNGNLEQMNIKFATVEEKLIGALQQKQKLLTNLNYQIENHDHSIAAIEEWIKTDHGRGNLIKIFEESLKQKIVAVQTTGEIKIQILEQKFKSLQQTKQSINLKIKNLQRSLQEKDEKDQLLREEIKKQLTTYNLKIEQKINKIKNQNQLREQKISSKDGQQKFLDDIYSKRQMEKDKLEQKKKINQLSSQIDSLEGQQQKINLKVKQLQKKLKNLEDTSKNIISQRINSVYSQQNMQTSSKKSDNDLSSNKNLLGQKKQKIKTDNNPFKKPSIFGNDAQVDSFDSQYLNNTNNMRARGGVRGLLQKSKEKQQFSKRNTLGTLGGGRSSKKQLPPVKEDPLAKKKKLQKRAPEPEEQIVYQIDEEGYLMDEDGNYLHDENGEMIKLSEEQINRYCDDQS